MNVIFAVTKMLLKHFNCFHCETFINQLEANFEQFFG